MAFLTPLYLFAMAAVGVPLLLHLIRREQVPKIVFSTLRFLKRSKKKSVLFQKVQQWLLLLLRMAAFALLALAFARPFLQGDLSALAGFRPRSVVIALDMSMSMRYGDRADEAGRAALTVLDQLNPGDEAALVVFAEGAELIREWTVDPAQLARTVTAEATPTYHATRYLPALKAADQLLERARFLDRFVYLISDFQATGFTGPDRQWRMAPGVQLETLTVGRQEAANLAVTGVSAPSRVARDGQESRVLVRVRSHGTPPRAPVPVHLSLNGRETAVKAVDLTRVPEAVAEFSTTFVAQGVNRGVAHVEDVGLTADDDFYFTVNVLPPIRILCGDGEPSAKWHEDEVFWLRQALTAERAPFRLTVRTPGDLTADDIRKSDVVLLANVSDLPPAAGAALAARVEAGGGLIIALGDRVSAASFGRTFGPLSPGTLGAPVILDPDGPEAVVFADVDARHPILRPLTQGGTGDLGTARFTGYVPVQPAAGADVLIRFDTGEPALLEKRHGSGKVLLFASSLDTEWSNFPLRALYLPMLHEMVRYVAEREVKERTYTVGDVVPATVGDRPAQQVRTPTGETVTVAATPEGGAPLFHGTTRPGIYEAQGPEGSEPFAVNVPFAESDLTPMDPLTLVEAVRDTSTTPRLNLAAQHAALQLELERTQGLWWWGVLVVCGLLILETFVSNRTYR